MNTHLVQLSPEQSTSIRFFDHRDGITILGFRSQKTGQPTSDYDYPDPERQHYSAIKAAERPGSFFRRALRANEWPAHIAKRPAMTDETLAPPVIETAHSDASVIVVDTSAPPPPPATPPAKIEAEATDIVSRARAIEVKDQGGYRLAADIARGVRAIADEAEKHHRPVIDSAYRTHKEALAALNRIIEPLKSAEKELRMKMESFLAEQERIRREAERRAQEEAARLQREAEARARAEYEAQLAAAREQAERERAAKEAELEAQIEEAEAKGASAIEIEAMMEQAEEAAPPVEDVFVPPPYVPPVAVRVPAPPPPTAAGVSSATTVVGVVVDKLALIAYIAQHPEYADLVEVKQGAVDRIGKLTGGKLQMGGVRWETKSNVRIRK